jgi:2-dehydro-3-deoxyglucarate aldolase/4-hydroxy-2-oxoheptanedioate aldolase
MLLATTRSADIVPLVRVPATQYHLLSGPLDSGAMGLMVPMVESEEQARLIVHSAKYPPHGGRGSAFTLAHDDYEGGDIVGKMASANDEILLIAQIETKSGVESAGAIAAVDGIDVLWIGHFDLSASLGIPGQFEDPDYLRAVDRVLDACHRHGKTPGIMAADAQAALPLLGQGFRAIACGGDLWIYGQALSQGIEEIRRGNQE